MLTTAKELLPIALALGAALIAKKCNVLDEKDGSRLLKLVFYVTIPPLVFVSSSSIKLTHSLLIFFILPLIVAPICFWIGQICTPHMQLKPLQKGVFVAAPMIVNSAFVLPFLLSTYGQAGTARVVIFNVLNNPIIFIWAYAAITVHSPKALKRSHTIKQIALSPPLWALILGLLCNSIGLVLPSYTRNALLSIGNLTGMLVIISLGLLLRPTKLHLRSVLLAALIRSGIGLTIGLIVVVITHATGIDRTAILLLASAPVGFNLLTFVSVEKLDEAYAAQIASYSLLIALPLATAIVLLTA
jgi:predicted permease